MPKILVNIRGKLIEETRRQIKTKGYGATSIRSVAQACGIATGTLYNYFESKDKLIAAFMIEDWQAARDIMTGRIAKLTDPTEVIGVLYDELSNFCKDHEMLINDPEACVNFTKSAHEKHGKLIEQIEEMLAPSCAKRERESGAPVTKFTAEAMLNWLLQGYDFDDFIKIIKSVVL